MVRIESILDNVLTNKLAKLSEQKQTPVMMVTELVEPLQLVIKSLKSKPNEDKLPKLQAKGSAIPIPIK